MPRSEHRSPFPHGASFGYHTATVLHLLMAVVPSLLQFLLTRARAVARLGDKIDMMPALTRLAFALPWWGYVLAFGLSAALLVLKEVVLRSRRLRGAVNLLGIVSGTCLLCAYLYALLGFGLTFMIVDKYL